MQKVTRLVAGTAIVNSLFEDVLGISSPVPSPPAEMLRTAYKNSGEDMNNFEYAYRLAGSGIGSTLENVPILGNFKYGGGFFDTTGKIIEDVAALSSGEVKTKERAARIASRFIPGGGTIYKYGIKPEETSSASMRSLSGGMSGLKGLQ